MKTIAFCYPYEDGSERHIVINKISSVWIRRSTFDESKGEICHWIVCVDLGNFSHSSNYDSYAKAIEKYNEILDAIEECK